MSNSITERKSSLLRTNRRQFLQWIAVESAAVLALAACGGRPLPTSSFTGSAEADAQPPERLYPYPESIFELYVDGSVAFYSPNMREFEKLTREGADALDAMYRFFGKHMDHPIETNIIVDAILNPRVDSNFPIFDKTKVDKWVDVIAARFSPDGLFVLTTSDLSRRFDPIGVGVAVVSNQAVTPDRIKPTTSPQLKGQSEIVRELVIQICANAARPARIPAQGIVVPPSIRQELIDLTPERRDKNAYYSAFSKLFKLLEQEDPAKLQELLKFRTPLFDFSNISAYQLLSGTAFSPDWTGFENLTPDFELPAGSVQGIHGFQIMPTNKTKPGKKEYEQTIAIMLERMEIPDNNISSVLELKDATPELTFSDPPRYFFASSHHFIAPSVATLDV